MTLQPMIHVAAMGPAVDFYERLGATVTQGSRDGDWALLSLAGGELSLLAHPPNPEQAEGAVELNFAAGEPLEAIEAALRRAGLVPDGPIEELGFGRQLTVSTPDGLLLKINELRDP